MVEFAYGPTGHNPHYGAVRNPWNTDHITGGSSSGSGSAVAARLTFAALGSDTGGSIRMPAHFCGITGFKTTDGRISRAGAMPLSFIARHGRSAGANGEDCATARRADGRRPIRAIPTTAAGAELGWPRTRSLKGLKIGVPTASMSTISIPTSRARSTRPSRRSRRRAPRSSRSTLPDQAPAHRRREIVLAAEAAAFHKRWMIARPRGLRRAGAMRLQNGLRYRR